MARFKKGHSKISDEDVIKIIEKALIVNANILKNELENKGIIVTYPTCLNKLINMDERGILKRTEHQRNKLMLREWRMRTDGFEQNRPTDTE